MGKYKISENVYTGTKELNKTVSFLDEKIDQLGAILIKESGFVKLPSDLNFDNFKLSQGTNVGTVKIKPGIAVDKQNRRIVGGLVDSVSVASNGVKHWFKISYGTSNLEQGTVDIGADGNLIGSGTKFTEVLRGLPNRALSKIRFPESTLNNQEYFVAQVNNDTNCQLQGDFVSEVGLKYAVFGTFAGSSSPSLQQQNIFEYDSVNLEIIVQNDKPTIIEGAEFLIGWATNDGSLIEIRDFRGDYLLNREKKLTKSNPIIGVESIRFNHARSTKSSNVVRVGWGVRSSNYSFNSSSNTITLNSISGGGIIIETLDFVNGQLNGFVVYSENFAIGNVISSIRQDSQINLLIDTIESESLISGEIRIVPNCEFVNLFFRSEQSIASKEFSFPSSFGFADIEIPLYDNQASGYVVRYNHKADLNASQRLLIPNHTVGYLNENSFQIDGSLKPLEDRTRVPYTSASSSFIFLQEPGDSYANIVEGFLSQDKTGLLVLDFNSLQPVNRFFVGVTEKDIILQADSFTLSFDIFVDLVKIQNNIPIAKDGNSFEIEVRGNVSLSGFRFSFVTDYVSPADPGFVVYEPSQSELDRSQIGNFKIKFTFDEETSQWLFYDFNKVSFQGEVAGGSLAGTYPNPRIANNVNLPGGTVSFDKQTNGDYNHLTFNAPTNQTNGVKGFLSHRSASESGEIRLVPGSDAQDNNAVIFGYSPDVPNNANFNEVFSFKMNGDMLVSQESFISGGFVAIDRVVNSSISNNSITTPKIRILELDLTTPQDFISYGVGVEYVSGSLKITNSLGNIFLAFEDFVLQFNNVTYPYNLFTSFNPALTPVSKVEYLVPATKASGGNSFLIFRLFPNGVFEVDRTLETNTGASTTLTVNTSISYFRPS